MTNENCEEVFFKMSQVTFLVHEPQLRSFMTFGSKFKRKYGSEGIT